VSRLIARWVLTALCVLLVARVVPGFDVHSFLTALFAAAVIGLVNATLGLVLKVITFPLILLSFGLLLLLINAALLELASWFVPGFEVHGFWPALWGALLLSLLNIAVKWVVRED
jgi:putative membrane protein